MKKPSVSCSFHSSDWKPSLTVAACHSGDKDGVMEGVPGVCGGGTVTNRVTCTGTYKPVGRQTR